MRFQLLKIFLLVLSLPTLAFAAIPKVESVTSKIEILSGSELSVEERYVFHVGIDDKHDVLERALPFELVDRSGRISQVRYTIQSLECDGGKDKAAQSWRWDRGRLQYLQVVIGSQTRFFSAGQHSCILRYNVHGLLRRDINRDAIWFSSLGSLNAWSVGKVQVTFVMPFGVERSKLEALGFVGHEKSFAQDFAVTSTENSEIIFTNTRPLAAGESLDLYLAWPPGFVEPIAPLSIFSQFVRRYFSVIIATFTLLLLLVYLLLAPRWFKNSSVDDQVDLEQVSLSPASLRYLIAGECDLRGFISGLLNLAVAGVIKIVDHNQQFFLVGVEKAQAPENLGSEELSLLHSLEPHLKVPLLATDGALLQLAGGFFNQLQSSNPLPALVTSRVLQRTWLGFAVLQLILSLLTLLSGWLIALQAVLCFASIVAIWVLGKYRGQFELQALVFSAIILLISMLLGDLINAQAGWIVGFLMIICLWLVLGVWFCLCYPALRAYKDKLGVVALYSEFLGNEHLRAVRPGDLVTAQLFERFMPHAVALGTEHSWSQGFGSVLAKSVDEPHTQSTQSFKHYQPAWFVSSSKYDFFEFINRVLLKLIELK